MATKPKPRQRLMRFIEDSTERYAWATDSWSGTIDPETGRTQEYEISIWKDTNEMECSCMDASCRKKSANLADPRTDASGCKHIRALLERLRRR